MSQRAKNQYYHQTDMAEKYQHKIAADLRAYAKKIAGEKAAAGEGAPDRMTAGDGDGGVEVNKGSRPHDVGEDEVKRDQPTDGKQMKATEIPAGSPDRMTAGDGDGGVDVKKDSRPDDPGEDEVKQDQPKDGETRKAAGNLSQKAAAIRGALLKANPALAAKIEEKEKAAAKEGGDAPKPLTHDLSQDTLAKIASAVLSTDEGVRFVQDNLEKQAGEEAARAQIQDAMAAAQTYDQTEQIKQAAFDDLGNKVQAIDAALEEHGVTEKHADAVIKQAALHKEKIDAYEHPLLKAAYVQGMDDAALMSAADDAAGEEGVPPVDEALPMGGEELGEEEIMTLLQEMLASGEITEEDIAAALAATEGGAEDPAAAAEPAAV